MVKNKLKKLNLGAGTDPREGYVNIDKVKLEGINVVHDLEDLPLPFKNNEFDFILCNDVFEHIDYVSIMPEIYRILKPKGILKLRIPHFSSPYNFIDPTHKNLFSFETMSFFTKTTRWNEFYFKDRFSKVISTSLEFDKCGWLAYNKIVERIVNHNEKTKRIYEGTFLRSLFPASNIHIKIQK